MARNKSGVIIKGCIALPAETIKDDQEPSMFLVDARPHKIDDVDVVPRLTSRTKSMTEHESKERFEHCFVGLLEASLLIKSQNFVSRGEFLVRARELASTQLRYCFPRWRGLDVRTASLPNSSNASTGFADIRERGINFFYFSSRAGRARSMANCEELALAVRGVNKS
jgi:hypothetical protein